MATKKVRIRKPNEGEQPGFISKLSKYTESKKEEPKYSDEEIYNFILSKIQEGEFPEQVINELEKFGIERKKVVDTAYDLYDDYKEAEKKAKESTKAPYDRGNAYGEETSEANTEETSEDYSDLYASDEEGDDLEEAQAGGQFYNNSIFPKPTEPYYVGADAEPYDNAYRQGGAISKKKFIKAHIRKLKKAAEGDQVENNEFYLPPVGTINDPMGKYTQKGKMFAKSVQELGNNSLYKQQAEEAYKQFAAGGEQHDWIDELHGYGESLQHAMPEANMSFTNSGTMDSYRKGGILSKAKRNMAKVGLGSGRIRRANRALFGTPYAIPGVDVNYEFGPLGGLRKATADWDVSVLGDLVKFLPPRGGNMNSPFNTGYSMVSTPARMRDKVIRTVNNQALNEVASNTPGSTATQNNTTSKKAELTCPPGATYDANKGYCVDANGRMVFSPSTMLTKDPSELLTNPFVNPYADQIPGSYQNLKGKQAKTNVLTNAGVSPLQANTQDPFNYAAAAFPGPDMSYGMDQPVGLPGPAPTQYSLNELGVDPATLDYDQYIENKRAEDLKRLNTFVPSNAPINTVPMESSPMESLPAEMKPIENNSSTTFKPTWSVNTSNKPQEEFCYGQGCFEYSTENQQNESNAMLSLAKALEDYDPKNFNNLTLDELKTIIKNKKGKAFFGNDDKVNKLINTKSGERFLNKWLEFQKDRMQYFNNPIFKSADPLNDEYKTSLLSPSAEERRSGVDVYSDFLSRYGKFKPGDDVNMITKAVGPLDEEYENYQTGGFIDSENPDLYKFIYGGDDIYEEGGYLPRAQYGDWAQNRFNTGFQPRYSKQRQRPSIDPAIMNPFAADGWRENATQNLMGRLNSGVQQPKTTTTQPTTTQPTTTTTNTTQPGTTQPGGAQQGAPAMFNFMAPPSRRGIFGLTRDFNYGSGFSPVNWQVPEGTKGIREVAYKDRGKWYNPFDTKRVKEYYAVGEPGTQNAPGQPAGTNTTQAGSNLTQPTGTTTPPAINESIPGKNRNVSGMTITNVEGNEAKGIDSKGRLVSGDFASDRKMNRQDRRYQRRFGEGDEETQVNENTIPSSSLFSGSNPVTPSTGTAGPISTGSGLPDLPPTEVTAKTFEQPIGAPVQLKNANMVSPGGSDLELPANRPVPQATFENPQYKEAMANPMDYGQYETGSVGSGPITPEAISQSNTRLMGNPFADAQQNIFNKQAPTNQFGVIRRAHGGEMDYMPEYMAYGGYMPEAKKGITVDQPEFNDPNYIGKVVEESGFSWNPKQAGADLFGGKMSLTGMLTSVGNAIKNEKNLFDPARKAGRSSDAASPNTGQGGFGSAEVVGSNMGDKGWLASNSGRNIQGIGFEGNEVITKKGGQLGSNYKKGSVYTLTAKQIQEIIAAGGKVEYIK